MYMPNRLRINKYPQGQTALVFTKVQKTHLLQGESVFIMVGEGTHDENLPTSRMWHQSTSWLGQWHHVEDSQLTLEVDKMCDLKGSVSAAWHIE